MDDIHKEEFLVTPRYEQMVEFFSVWQTSNPVKFCVCNTNLCNSHTNPARSLRARQLFAQSMRSLDFIFPFDNSSRVSISRSGVSASADDYGRENAADGAQPQRARGGKQRRLQCYTCGSLFNRDTPPCEKFDPTNSSQITTCRKEIFDTYIFDFFFIFQR